MKKEFVIQQIEKLPVIAILRGVRPAEVLEVGAALHEAGIMVMEVTMNSPEAPLKSIELLASHFEGKMAVGAGTVLSVEQVEAVKECGGALIVSPNTDARVISRTAELGLFSMPGVATCSEGFSAIEAGADHLKIFPASVMGPSGLQDLTAVMPKRVGLFAVGGVNAENMKEWILAGAKGVGLGSNLYAAGDSPEEVSRKAGVMVGAYRKAIEG